MSDQKIFLYNRYHHNDGSINDFMAEFIKNHIVDQVISHRHTGDSDFSSATIIYRDKDFQAIPNLMGFYGYSVSNDPNYFSKRKGSVTYSVRIKSNPSNHIQAIIGLTETTKSETKDIFYFQTKPLLNLSKLESILITLDEMDV